MYAHRLVNKLWAYGRCVSRCAQIVTLCIVLASFAFSPAPASAQSASFRSVDTNSDGVLTFDELIATFGRRGANRLLRSTDHNGDGRITIPELRRGPDDDDRDRDQRPGPSDDRDDNRDDDRDSGDDGGDDGDDGGDDDSDDGGDDGGDDD